MPASAGLDARYSMDLAPLAAHRRRLDTIIRQWTGQLTDAHRDATLAAAETELL